MMQLKSEYCEISDNSFTVLMNWFISSFKSELERKEHSLQTVVKQRNEERTLKEDERKQKDEALTK